MELKIIEIRDKGQDSERIFIKILEDCNLGDFIVYDETLDEDGNISNLWPHMYRFKKRRVRQGEYISLRTHEGKDRVGTLDDKITTCYYLYWGLDKNFTIFNEDGDTVHIVKVVDETSKKV